MTGVPKLFDTTQRARQIARALSGGPERFLLDRVLHDFAERMQPVLRPFADVLDFCTPLDGVGAVMAAREGARSFRALCEVSGQRQGAEAVTMEQPGLLPESCDCIVSLLALHTVNDLPGVLVQMRRALRPDGLFIAALAGGDTLTELRSALFDAEIEVTGGASPRIAPFADVRSLGQLLQRAGFALPVADSDTITVRYSSPIRLMHDLRAMAATNALAERSRRPMKRTVLMRALELYAERFSDADGKVRATFEIVWLSGWAPHESQQKPLKPGSAKMRLADALKAMTEQDRTP